MPFNEVSFQNRNGEMRLMETQLQHHQGLEYQKTKGLISKNNNSACFLHFGHFSNNSYRLLNKVVEC